MKLKQAAIMDLAGEALIRQDLTGNTPVEVIVSRCIKAATILVETAEKSITSAENVDDCQC